MHSSLFFGISLSHTHTHTHAHTLSDDLGIDSWVGEKYNSVSVEKSKCLHMIWENKRAKYLFEGEQDPNFQFLYKNYVFKNR